MAERAAWAERGAGAERVEGGRLGWCGLLGPEGRSGPPGWAERGEREKCCGLGLKLGLGLGWVKGLGFLFPTLLLSKSNSNKV